MRPEIERCRREIAEIEAQLRSGHRDLQGLLLALSDWHAELRFIERDILNSFKGGVIRTQLVHTILSAPRGAPDVKREHLEVA
jgi:hypothetical protein